MNTNPFHNELYNAKTSCFIDASTLGDTVEPEDCVNSIPMDSEGSQALPLEKNNDEQCAIDSLESSRKPSPCVAELSQSVPISWFVNLSREHSIECSPRCSDGTNSIKPQDSSKNNIFKMFVDLRDENTSKETNEFFKKPPEKLRAVSTASSESVNGHETCGECKESGFVSDLPDDKLPSSAKSPTINENNDEPKYPSLNSFTSYFVKLSDMDKVPKLKLDPVKEHVPFGNMRMTKSIPERKMSRHTGSRISRSTGYIPIYAENITAICRLFPKLMSESECSNFTPLRSLTPTEMEELQSESESSMQSVMNDGVGDSDSQQAAITSRLGEDLLRMFDKEIATDVCVDCSGRRIRAHKCILATRCPHFAALMSGGMIESAGNIIYMEGYSYNTVYFTLRYIYSGVSLLAETVNIFELTSLADKLGLVGLKECIAATLIKKYCHNFHKPCPQCAVGVLECLPISMEFGLDEIYQKSLNWLTEYYVDIWPTEAFATMHIEALERVYSQQKVNMTPENVASLVYGCKEIIYQLPKARWTESVRRISASLMKSAENLAARHLSKVLQSLLTTAVAPVDITEDFITNWMDTAIILAPIKEVFKAYELLSRLYSYGRKIFSDSEMRIVGQWRRMCEDTLVAMPPHNTLEAGFVTLPQELKNRLIERGCNMDSSASSSSLRTQKLVPERMARTLPGHHLSMQQRMELARMYKTFIPYKQKPSPTACIPVTVNKEQPNASQKANRNPPPVIRTTRTQRKREEHNATYRNASVEAQYKRSKRTQNLATADMNLKARHLTMSSSTESSQSNQSRGYRPNIKPIQHQSKSSCSISQASSSTLASVDVQHRRQVRTSAKKVDSSNKNVHTLRSCNVDNRYKENIKSYSVSSVPAIGVLSEATKCDPSSSQAGKKSRIPIYTGGKKSNASAPALSERSLSRAAQEASAAASGKKLPSQLDRPSTSARMLSLMSPTTSSAAKMVSKKSPCTKHSTGKTSSGESSVSTLHRSTTFVKDEPCFPGSPDISKS